MVMFIYYFCVIYFDCVQHIIIFCTFFFLEKALGFLRGVGGL